MREDKIARAMSEIRAITVDYFTAMDRGDLHSLQAVFNDARVRSLIGVDGVGVSDERPDPFDWSTQAVDIFRGAVRFYDDGTPKTCHFTTNLRVILDADLQRATGVSRFKGSRQRLD